MNLQIQGVLPAEARQEACKMFDFRKLLSPEARCRLRHFHQEQLYFSALTDAELRERAVYYLGNCQRDGLASYQPGEPVYDASMRHTILPELIARLDPNRERPVRLSGEELASALTDVPSTWVVEREGVCWRAEELRIEEGRVRGASEREKWLILWAVRWRDPYA